MQASGVHIREVLASALGDRPEQPALEVDGVPTSRGELLRSARALACGLRAHGIEPGARVGLLLREPLPFVQSLFGGWLNANTLVPLSPNLLERELLELVRDAELQALIVSEALRTVMDDLIAALPRPPSVFVIGDTGRHECDARLFECGSTEPAMSAGARDPVLMLYTFEGMRRTRRAAILDSANLLAQLEIARDVLGLKAADRVFCQLPPFAIAGASVITSCICAAATVLLPTRYTLRHTSDLLASGTIHTLLAHASLCSSLAARSGSERHRVAGLQRCVSVGEVDGSLTGRPHEATGIPIHRAHALAAAGGFLCSNARVHDKPRSLGHPRWPHRVQIVDGSGRELPHEQVGRVMISGPAIATPPGSWLATGEYGFVDRDGDLFIAQDGRVLARASRFVPYDPRVAHVVTDTLLTMPEVLDAGVCFMPNGRRGGRMRMVIELKPGATLERGAVEAHLRNALHPDDVPDEYLFVSELPRLPAGHIHRRALRRLREVPGPA